MNSSGTSRRRTRGRRAADRSLEKSRKRLLPFSEAEPARTRSELVHLSQLYCDRHISSSAVIKNSNRLKTLSIILSTTLQEIGSPRRLQKKFEIRACAVIAQIAI
ncbi:hypothetical protein EVAR_40033_1 [Eumeta japonica]|uniref:Uncharacterized protein n=1 Tax=Eumeta variegata TaxID=151549 RepID=A0A4C1WBX7_EUMVA|nr:hypothetical protein EVAR_40033_1 [Eumeta japonica]